ncbi:DUF4386 domain-containing protein [Sporocytophaga myxococcoides]|uniref:DUF4386 domain-containing protein n=1 Tax=Sporocytophaga myxococcoides TaxID=153721 RepID=UPI00056D155B|nr:DUF4386 domain-containing protein [Sporocytophaga myxococcoides]
MPAPVSSLRKTSLTAGILYLLTFVSIPTLALYDQIHAQNYILSSGSDTAVIIGNILELIVGFTCIGSAVALYPVLRKKNEGMALCLVSFRILEATTIFIGVMFLLTVVTLHQRSAGTEALVTSRTLVIMYDRIFLIGQSLMPAINDILLGILLYQSRLVPRSLSLIGIIGGPVLLAGDFLILFDFIGQRAPLIALTAVPVAVFELSLGVYLIVKGFKPTPDTQSK